MKQFLILLALGMLVAAPASAQTAKILSKKVEEGVTSFLTMNFYDENNQPVQPERVWVNVKSSTGTTMQAQRILTVGGTGDTGYFGNVTDTASSLSFLVTPCGNRIENESSGGSEKNVMTVTFAYPTSCDLSATGLTPGQACKFGAGTAIYEKVNDPAIVVRKLQACASVTPAAWIGVTGCRVPSSTVAGSACDGTE